jgi:DNA-binding CsgD family transcriptional regulator
MTRPYNLTDRQVQILAALADGMSRRQICQALFIEPNTLKTHLYRIGKQMGCGERAGMVALAYRAGVLRIPDAELIRQANELQQRIREQRVTAMKADLARQSRAGKVA